MFWPEGQVLALLPQNNENYLVGAAVARCGSTAWPPEHPSRERLFLGSQSRLAALNDIAKASGCSLRATCSRPFTIRGPGLSRIASSNWYTRPARTAGESE